jgi:EAL domain-containing protein (putative c-di-GMP-specific phosphodiesterase class I)
MTRSEPRITFWIWNGCAWKTLFFELWRITNWNCSINPWSTWMEASKAWRHCWPHPIHGTISPRQFIPIAEETGLIIEIGSWVIRQASTQGAEWLKSGYRCVRISVNVSALQFERRDFVPTVATTLALGSFPDECWELELTESYIMRDLPQYVFRMTQLRDLGVSVSVDDFGTGYSSVSYLAKLPVDSRKIDQSFLRGLQEPEGSLPVVQSMVRWRTA